MKRAFLILVLLAACTEKKFEVLGNNPDATHQNVSTNTNTATNTNTNTNTSTGTGTGTNQLLSISVTPSVINLVLGASENFKAMANFSDGSTQDVTTAVTWSSAAPNAEPISAAGKVTVNAMETATQITAQYSSGGNSFSANATVILKPRLYHNPMVRTFLGFPEVQSLSDTDFVNRVYSTILLRSPTNAEQTSALQLLGSGTTRDVFVGDILATSEFEGDRVDSFYWAYLNRASDPGGRATWVSILAGGTPEELVIQSFLASNEFTNDNPTNSGFVTALYLDLLVRQPSSAEVNTWVTFMQTHTRGQTIQGFMESLEYSAEVINEYYIHFLNRFPANGENQSYVTSLQSQIGALSWPP